MTNDQSEIRNPGCCSRVGFVRRVSIPEGLQKVAGGRSEAKTSGKSHQEYLHPGGVPECPDAEWTDNEFHAERGRASG